MTRSGSTSYLLLRQVLICLVATTLMVAGIVPLFNLHLHVLSDGRLVVHSHPVQKDDPASRGHHHSRYEYSVLASLGKILLGASLLGANAVIGPDLVEVGVHASDDSDRPSGAETSAHKRSPPSFALL